MDKKKKKHDAHDDTISDYEELLNGLTADSDDESAGSEDGLVLSELLGDDSGRDDARSGKDVINLKDFSDMDFSDLTIEDDSPESSSGGTKKTNSGKFEIELDDNLSDYASILSELEKTGDSGASSETEEDRSAGGKADGLEFDLDLSGFDGFTGEAQEQPVETPENEESLDDILASMEPEEEKAETAEREEAVIDIIHEAAEEPVPDLEPELASAESDGAEPEASETIAEPEESMSEETAAAQKEQPEAAEFAPEVSYTGFIAEEDTVPEEEPLFDIAPDEAGEEPAAEAPPETEVLQEEETALSYADFIDDKAEEPISDEEAVFDLAGESEPLAAAEESSAEEDVFSFDKDDLVLDAEDLDLDSDAKEFAFDTEELAAEPETDEIGLEKEEGVIVVSSGDAHEEMEEEIDFLAVDETAATKSDDSFLGVVDVREAKLPEIMLEGIEMDPASQMTMVTRAELLLAQGKRDLARDVYEQIARERGVSPFVAKRLQQLKGGRSETSAEAEELANQ